MALLNIKTKKGDSMARILTIEELRHMTDDYVCLQIPNSPPNDKAKMVYIKEITPRTFTFKTTKITADTENEFSYETRTWVTDPSLYYVKWRCWNEQPTPEEEAMPFEKPKEEEEEKDDFSEMFSKKFKKYLDNLAKGILGDLYGWDYDDSQDSDEEEEEEPKPEDEQEESGMTFCEEEQPECPKEEKKEPEPEGEKDDLQPTVKISYEELVNSKIISEDDLETLPIGHSFKLCYFKGSSPFYSINDANDIIKGLYWSQEPRNILTVYKVGQRRDNANEALRQILVEDPISKQRAVLDMDDYDKCWTPWRLSTPDIMIEEYRYGTN